MQSATIEEELEENGVRSAMHAVCWLISALVIAAGVGIWHLRDTENPHRDTGRPREHTVLKYTVDKPEQALFQPLGRTCDQPCLMRDYQAEVPMKAPVVGEDLGWEVHQFGDNTSTTHTNMNE